MVAHAMMALVLVVPALQVLKLWLFDVNGDGVLTHEEFVNGFLRVSLAIQQVSAGEVDISANISNDLMELFDLIDNDCSGVADAQQQYHLRLSEKKPGSHRTDRSGREPSVGSGGTPYTALTMPDRSAAPRCYRASGARVDCT